MTAFTLSTAFGEGLHRERTLFGARDNWTRDQWLARKVFLESEIDEETKAGTGPVVKARLQGRLMAVCLEGQARFGD